MLTMSFHKKSEIVSSKGTKGKNNTLYISSGIPSLDHIIGGGLPTGAIFLIEEDVLGNYCRVMSKYFLAEGLVCNHQLFVASADENPQNIIKELPKPCITCPDEISNVGNDMDKMKIAWRYEGLSQVESSFGANTTFGHHFDLSKYVDEETIKSSNITFWTPCIKDSKHITLNYNSFQNKQYLYLLQKIKEISVKEEFQCNHKGQQSVLRINICSLGSPLWLATDCENYSDPRKFGQEILKFLYCLRIILKDTNCAAFITVPTHLFENESLIKRMIYCVDNAVKLESFAGSSRETNPVFKDYNGLLHITKLSAVNSMVPFVPPSLDLAFKLRRKKFIIEKLHLPPELSETSEREQDDIISTPMSCGGFKKKDIDF